MVFTFVCTDTLRKYITSPYEYLQYALRTFGDTCDCVFGPSLTTDDAAFRSIDARIDVDDAAERAVWDSSLFGA